MDELTIRSVLRIAAVLTMLLAIVLMTRTIVGAMAAQAEMEHLAALSEMGGITSRFAGWQVAGELTTWAWGLVLYAASPYLARRIVA